jgi:hypothetical protein
MGNVGLCANQKNLRLAPGSGAVDCCPMVRFKKFLIVILLLGLFILNGCEDLKGLMPRDTSSLLVPRFKRSDVFGFVAGLGTTFAAVPDLIAMLRHENLAILLVYRHILEMLDSVNIQVAECAATPAALQLRAMFEALLTLENMTEDKGKTMFRAYAYLYEVELQRKHFYFSQDPSTAEGKHLRQLMSNDPYHKDSNRCARPCGSIKTY